LPSIRPKISIVLVDEISPLMCRSGASTDLARLLAAGAAPSGGNWSFVLLNIGNAPENLKQIRPQACHGVKRSLKASAVSRQIVSRIGLQRACLAG